MKISSLLLVPVVGQLMVGCAVGDVTNASEVEIQASSSSNLICEGVGQFFSEPHYIPSSDGKECSMPRTRCVADHELCPPPPTVDPTQCRNGRIVTERTVSTWAHGIECLQLELHCVTNDLSACPMASPIHPDFCKDGQRATETKFIASSDGKECEIPEVHCLSKDPAACPMP